MRALAAGLILIVSPSSGVMTASLRSDGEDSPASQQKTLIQEKILIFIMGVGQDCSPYWPLGVEQRHV